MDILKIGLVAVGGYLLYEYLYGASAAGAPFCLNWSGCDNSGNPTIIPGQHLTTVGPGVVQSLTPTTAAVVPPSSVAATSLISSNVDNQVQHLGEQWALDTGARGLNSDNWNYFYTQVTGRHFTPQEGSTILSALGLNEATRGTTIPYTLYISALVNNGLA